MDTLKSIKNRLIDQILTTKNEALLKAIDSIFTSTQTEEKILTLSSEQIEMLLMSEKDIKQNNIVAESDLDTLLSDYL
ncbi:hypothetical protein [Lacinutrix mariniflava]|uniref:hypothetical protein n=1 Tax=Lacinutrix mariniflava TaxID=342955 RepID=UPI0006E4561C|nr:hypothetical protein [Lacinutrix mariniflava]